MRMESPSLERPDQSAPVSDVTFTDQQFRERLEAAHAADAVTLDSVRSTLAKIRGVEEEAHENGTGWLGRGAMHEAAFYLNSSDPLTLLHENAAVEGQHVMTVAGSGDFAQTFLANGAKELTIFDASLPAVLFNELKLVGLRRLDFDGYRAMFDTWKAGGSGGPIFDVASYQRVRDGLSGPAREYFDTLVREENQDLMHHDASKRDRAFNGFSRSRQTAKKAFTSFIGDVITTEGAYAELQGRARNAEVSIRLMNAEVLATHAVSAKADTAYLSNIGYRPEITAAIAGDFLKAGVERVIFTTSAQWIRSEAVLGAAVRTREEYPYEGLSLRFIAEDPDMLYGYLMELRK